jgi:hypothetical protein
MTISFARHQFPPAIIRHAVWVYVRFTFSYRDVEDLLAEHGLDVSYETVRRWVLKFGPLFARELRRRRPRPMSRWHLNEMALMIAGTPFWLWRAVDDEGEVLDLLVQRRRASSRGSTAGTDFYAQGPLSGRPLRPAKVASRSEGRCRKRVSLAPAVSSLYPSRISTEESE